MNVLDLLSQLRRAGIQLSLDGDKLKIKAPPGAVTEDIKSQLKEQKQQIIEFLQESQAQQVKSEFQVIDRAGRLPLSFTQQALWTMDRLNPGSIAYNLPMAFKFTGDLDVSLLNRALSAIIARHETLRSRMIEDEDGNPQVLIDGPSDISIPVHGLNLEVEESADTMIRNAVYDLTQKSFDLEQGPLCRFDLIKLGGVGEGQFVLVICVHHIIADGLSLNLLIRELALLYAASLRNMPAPLASLPVQYVDFANWQRQRFTGQALDQEIRFWREQLKGVPSLLALPTDRPRPPIQTTRGTKYYFDLPDELAHDLSQFCQSRGITLFMGLMTGLQVVLSRHANQCDFCIGMPTAGRNHKEVEQLIGFFVNGVLVRADLNGNPSWEELLQRVKQRLLDVFAHQDTPAQLIIDHLDVKRNPAYPPLAQVGFQLQNFASAIQGGEQDTALLDTFRQMTSLSMAPIRLEEAESKFDMIISALQNGQTLSGYVEYNTDLFDEATVARMMQHWQWALRSMLKNTSVRIEDFPLESEAALRQALGVADDEVLLPLTSTQIAFLQDVQLRPQTRQYAVGFRYPMPFNVDVELLKDAIHRVNLAHATLRARYVACDLPWADPYYQVIQPNDTAIVETIALDGVDDPDRYVEAHFERWCYRTHDILGEPLLRLQILTAAPDRHWLLLSTNHIVIDGVAGMAYLLKILASYEALLGVGDAPNMQDHFAEFIREQRPLMDRQPVLDFWRSKALDVLPLDFPVPRLWSGNRDYQILSHDVDNALWTRIREYCRRQKTHPSIFFRMLAALLIKQYCRPEGDFVVYDIQSGRKPGQEMELGVYYQQVPYILSLESLGDDREPRDFFRHQREYRKDIRDAQQISLAAQNRILPAGRITFQVNYFNFLRDVEVCGVKSFPHTFSSHVDSTVQVFVKDYGDELALELWFDGAVFVPLNFLQRMESLAEQFAFGGELRFGELDYCLAQERDALAQWNHTEAEGEMPASIVTWFETAEAQYSDNVAVIHGDRRMSYRELNQQANQLARYLLQEGLNKGERVGICLSRSPLMLVSVWAVLKAGGVYIPIEASYPRDRIHYILQDSEARFLLTETCIQKRLPDVGSIPVLLDTLADRLAGFSGDNLADKPSADDGIYIIYTSGSTGNPKGAAVTHGGEVNLQRWYTSACEFSAQDRTIIVSAFGFDLTQKNLFAPTLCGGAIVIPQMDEYDAEIVAAEIEGSGATHMNCAPSALYALVEHCEDIRARQLKSLRWVYLGGEPIRMNALSQWLQHPSCRAQVANSYGPTECTDVVSWYVIDDMTPLSGGVPIGKPICNTEIHVVNDALKPVPHGVVGEICIAGAGVGLGYLKRDELTAQVFVENPFGHGKLYRTGDLGRFMPDGNIEYIGRKDFQVKVRGLRIELGEIEHAIKQLPEVTDALVTVRDEQLVAYGVSAEPDAAGQWQSVLRSALPDYMVPARLILLPEWPLTPNGKVDRKALPDPDIQQRLMPYVAPRDDIEIAIADIWSQVLKRDEIGINDGFFDLGGHSLLANQIVSRLRKHFAIALPIRDLMTHPTVAELAQRVRLAQKHQNAAAILPCHRDGRIPLSIPQQRLWLLDQIEPGNPAYHVPSIIRINGQLDINTLNAAYAAVINRHEGLRAVFAEDEQGPYQRIQPEQEWAIDVIQAHGSDDEALKRMLASDVLKPFMLAEGPLFRARLIEVEPSRYVLAIVLHHIVTDGWSNGILVRDLAQAYALLHSGSRIQFAPLQLQYADFASWQRQQFSESDMADKLAYWKTALADVPALELPTDRRRPAIQTFKGATARLELNAETTARLQALAGESQATLFMVFMAAYAGLLQKYSGQEDFAIGSPVAGRDRPELEPIVGFFVNTIALRVQPEAGINFRQLLDRVRETSLASLEHQDVPFEQIVEDINPVRDMSRSPLFQVMLAYQNLPQERGEDLNNANFGDISLAPFNLDIETAKFEQTLTLWPQQNKIGGSLTYNTDLFDAETARQFVRHFERFCDGVAQNPDLPLHQYDVLSPSEKRTQLEEWNQTAHDYRRDQGVHEWISGTAQQYPEYEAIRCGDQHLTHLQLDRLANGVANLLVEQGVGPGKLVGVALDRNLHLMTAILGIVKTGATYVPIDAAYPEERIRYILNESAISIVITRDHLTTNLPADVTRILLDQTVQRTDLNTSAPVVTGFNTDAWLYVIFTSGSTGKPKGTGAYHRSEMNLLEWYSREFGMNRDDRLLLLSAIGFDLTQKNLFGPLVSGATLVIPPFQEYDPARIVELVEQEGVTWINCAPSAFYPLVDDPADWPRLQTLRYVFLGGEPINLARLAPWLEQSGCQLVNSYGPTECADIAAYYRIELQRDLEAVALPIGRPNDNVSLFVLGDHQELLPAGAIGELCIGGDGVGPGYLNNAELTSQVFVTNPHLAQSPLMYRTGDRVRYRRDGVIEYLGRRDHQIKLRGYRVEAGEIQTVLNQHESAQDSLVDVLGSPGQADQLVAWVVCRELPEDHTDLIHQLKLHAEQLLPRFMVPDAWVLMERFPLTPNGKVDRKALPKPEWGQRSAPFIDPRNETEVALVQIWQEVLRCERISVTDNFFELGGHSLLATQVASRVRKNLGVTFPIRDLMAAPTIAAMAERIVRTEKHRDDAPIVPVSRDVRLPLSYAQQRLWLLDKIEPGSVAYNVPSVIRIHGPLDVALLEKALSKVFNRHEGLRAYFIEDELGAAQAILPVQDWILPVTRVEDNRLGQLETELKRLAAIELMTPFNLARGPLFRSRLFKLGEEEFVFSVVIHHIVTDGWSMNLLIRDLVTAYVQLSAHGDVYFESAPLQYADFAAWQRARLTGDVLAGMLGYWKQTLADVPALNLPTDFKRPPVQTFNGHSIRFALPQRARDNLSGLAQQENASLFMTLLATFAVVLQRYSGQDDFCIGTPVAGRDRTELENLVGFFVNTLAIRVRPDTGISFRDLVREVKSHVLDGFAHQEVPFEQIVEAIDPARDMSRSPLFQVMLAYQNLPAEQTNTGELTAVGDIRLEPYNPGVDASKFDMTLTLWEENQGLGGALQYNTDLFSVATIEKLIGHFSALAEVLAESPDAPLHLHEYLTPAEREQQLVEWNLTQTEYNDQIAVHEWIDNTAAGQPNAIAVKCGDDELSYRQLQTQSNQLANYLIAKGVKPDDRVAVCLDRNLNLMTVILGVLKAGATYVPLDASYPKERLDYILENAGIQIGITRRHLMHNLPESKDWVTWDEHQVAISEQTDCCPAIAHNPERLLYVIFTSGSTGKPKGTGAYHRSEINLLHWYINQFNMTSHDRMLLLSAVGFDLTQKNLFGTLAAGATLVIPEFQEYDGPAINALIEAERITWINCAPSAFYPLQDEPYQWQQLKSIRYLFLGGEPINLPRLANWLGQSQCQLVNSYGPTECTDIAAWYAIDVERDLDVSALPIGRPNDNVRLYVLGDQQEMLPIGAIGELYIGGDGVGPGYLNNAEQTEQVFIANPHLEGDRIYRTGDRVRYRPDGVVEYLGRRDHQMKLRGYRIEAGEIQAVINQTTGVKDSLVDVLVSDHKVQRLVAWVVADEINDELQSTLQRKANAFLPAFMVPESWVLLDAFPLTPNGKVDRKRLPKPDLDAGSEYHAPRTDIEATLCQLWASVLGVERVGVRDNFFQLGGQSLLATQLVSRMSRQLNRTLTVRMLFENATIETFAQALETTAAEVNRPSVQPRQQFSPAKLSFGQQRLWFFEQLNPGTSANNMPIALRIGGEVNQHALEMAFREIMRRHETMRTSFTTDENGEPLQIIHSSLDWHLPLVDLTTVSSSERKQQLEILLHQNRINAIPLHQAPVWRSVLVKTAETPEYHLLFCMHHIISDGASLVILFRELVTLYLAYAANQPSPLPELRLHYADFAEWQRDWLSAQRLESQLQYWQSKLARAPALLELPLDKPRPPVQSTAGASMNVSFPESFGGRMQEWCGNHGITPFMFMLTAWKLLLSRYSGQQDICIGVPTLGRNSPELESVIGFFIQSLVLRTRLDGNPTVEQALQRVRTTVLDGFSHGDVPVDLIVERLGVPRNPAYSPLVQVAFQLLDNASLNATELLGAGRFGDLELEVLSGNTTTAKFDLTLSLTQSGNQLAGSLEYNTSLFEEETIQRLLQHYQYLCEQMLSHTQHPVFTLDLQPPCDLIADLELDPEEYETVWPLSAMQYDMFMDNLVNPGSLQSSHGWHIHIHRRLDVDLWQRCLQLISDHQPMVRTRFVTAARPWLDMGYLAVRREKTIDFELLDFSDSDMSDDVLKTRIRDLIYRPYDLMHDDLIRYYVIKLADDHFVVVTAVHHAVLDGAGLNSLWEQVTELYNAFQEQQDVRAFSHVPPNFRDFVIHDRQVMDTADVLSFWQNRFSAVEPLDFTVPYPVPAAEHFITRELYLDDEHWHQLKRFCREHRITPALYLKSLFALMIQAYCRPDSDFSIQETMGGRIKGHLHSFGCYIQEIPFIASKAALAADRSFVELLAYARQFQKEIKDQRLISIGKQLEISPRGRIGFMFNYYQFLAHTEFLGEVFDPEGTPSDPANNVQFVVTEVGGRLKFNLFFHAHQFSDFGFLQRIESLSRQIIGGQAPMLGDLQFVTEPAEKLLVTETWNDTAADFDLTLCIHQRFEQQVHQHPDTTAVVDDTVGYSYGELNVRANQLAHYLRRHGVDRNQLVGLCADRSADFLVGILGIMKAGGAYVPMDPKYPQDRIEYMIENSEVSFLLTQEHLLEKTGAHGAAKRICLDRDWGEIAKESSVNPRVDMSPRDRAYMIYTSGSTGLPKGAIIRHDGAMNHIEAERKALQFDSDFSFLQTAPASSDISVWQFVGPVTCGGKVVVLDDVTHSRKLFELVKAHDISVVELVPVALQLLMEYVRTLPEAERALPALRWMMATGEAVSVDLVNDWLALFPSIPVVNAYGPTEAADDVIQGSIHEPLPADRKSVPIGKPLANLDVFIVDDRMRLVPPGVPGEICIGGIGVGEGYWQNPEKTAAAFVPNPFPNTKGGMLYRTGDLGRWLTDGSVEYLDRVDNQVKVRGFRIELGEVEAALSALPGVRENVVIVRHDLPGGTALAAYVVAADDVEAVDASSLRAQLRERLPDFMVPAALTVLDAMPLTPAGKIDRKALPRPDSLQLGGADYVPPRTALETQLVQIWESFLPVERISVRDNFFELGGHSLIGVRIMARVNKELGTSLQVAALLATQTVERLAQFVEQGATDEVGVLVPLVKNDQPPLFLIHPVGGDVLCYHDLARALQDSFSVFGIRSQGLTVGSEPFSSLDDLVSQYIHAIRTAQPQGPYRLGGQSLGGILALAVAGELERQGESVTDILLLDTYSPAHLRDSYPDEAAIIGSAMGITLPGGQTESLSNSDRYVDVLYQSAVGAGVLASDFPKAEFEAVYRVSITNHRFASQYEVESTWANVHHFTAQDNKAGVASGSTWDQSPQTMSYHTVPGGHETLMQGDNAITLAQQIRALIQRDNNNN